MTKRVGCFVILYFNRYLLAVNFSLQKLALFLPPFWIIFKHIRLKSVLKKAYRAEVVFREKKN